MKFLNAEPPKYRLGREGKVAYDYEHIARDAYDKEEVWWRWTSCEHEEELGLEIHMRGKLIDDGFDKTELSMK